MHVAAVPTTLAASQGLATTHSCPISIDHLATVPAVVSSNTTVWGWTSTLFQQKGPAMLAIPIHASHACTLHPPTKIGIRGCTRATAPQPYIPTSEYIYEASDLDTCGHILRTIFFFHFGCGVLYVTSFFSKENDSFCEPRSVSRSLSLSSHLISPETTTVVCFQADRTGLRVSNCFLVFIHVLPG
jgi:hypothetical protein